MTPTLTTPWEDRLRFANRECPKCDGNSFTLNDEGEAVDCDCSGDALARRIIENSGLPKRFREAGLRGFEMTSPKIATAFGQIQSWIRRLANHQSTDGLYLHGPVGTGKTHIACAAMRNLASDGWWSLFYSVPQLLFELRATVSQRNDDTEGDIIVPCETVPLLVLDDFGAEKLTDYARERLYLVFDNRYYRHLPTIVTSNLDLDGLARWDERIASRVEATCVAVHLDGPDYRKKLGKQLKESLLDGAE